jgi:endogenous inhibitor of DNA gyrase (YacG/DUF329 family)
MSANTKHKYDFALSRINNRRRLLLNDVLITNGFYALDGEAFTRLAEDARKALKLPTKTEAAIRATLLPFAGQEVTYKLNELIALRLAGGYSLLKQGLAVPASGSIDKATWLPLEITSVRYGPISRSGTHLLAELTMLVMAGSAVGYEIMQVMPMKFVITRFASQLGWPKFNKRRPSHAELVKMWFTGLVELKNRRLEVTQFDCSASQLAFNKQLRLAREKPCIRGHRIRCHLCPIGYMFCDRSTHRYTWIQKHCPKCNKEAMFDPEEPNQPFCLACRSAAARGHWAREQMSR